MRRCSILFAFLICFVSVTALHAADPAPKKQPQATQATIMLTLDDLKQAILPDVMEPDKKEWVESRLENFTKTINDTLKQNLSVWELRIAKLEAQNESLTSRTQELLSIITLLAGFAAFIVFNLHRKAKDEVETLKQFYKIELAELKRQTESALLSIQKEGATQLSELVESASSEIKGFIELELQKSKEKLDKYRSHLAETDHKIKLLQAVIKQQEAKLTPEQSQQLEDIANSEELPEDMKQSSNVLKLFHEEKWLEAHKEALQALKQAPAMDTYYFAAASAHNYANEIFVIDATEALSFYYTCVDLMKESKKAYSELTTDEYELWGSALKGIAELSEKDNTEELLCEAVQKSQTALYLDPENEDAKIDLLAEYSSLASINPEEYQPIFTSLYSNLLDEHSNKQKVFETLGASYCIFAGKNNISPTMQASLIELAIEPLLQSEHLKSGSGAYSLACVNCMKKNYHECRKWLTIAYEHDEIPSYQHVASDKDFYSVHNQPWFQQFLEKLKTNDESDTKEDTAAS